MLKKLIIVGKYVGVFSAILGVVSTVLSIRNAANSLSQIQTQAEKQHREEHAKQVVLWQKPAVYKLILNKGDEGIKFVDLLREYQVVGLTSTEITIEKEDLTENSLRLVLFDLYSDALISVVRPDYYKVVTDESDRNLNKSPTEDLERMVSPTLEFLSRKGNNGGYTSETINGPLIDFLKEKLPDLPVSTVDVQQLLTRLSQNGYIVIGPKYEIWNVNAMSSEEKNKVREALTELLKKQLTPVPQEKSQDGQR